MLQLKCISHKQHVAIMWRHLFYVLVFTDNNMPFRYVRLIIICYQLEFYCAFWLGFGCAIEIFLHMFLSLSPCSYFPHKFCFELIFCGLFSFTLISNANATYFYYTHHHIYIYTYVFIIKMYSNMEELYIILEM